MRRWRRWETRYRSPPTPVACAPVTSTVTLLFTDIEGSTRLWEQHPAAMRAALAAPRRARCARPSSSTAARSFKTVGDALLRRLRRSRADAVAAARGARSVRSPPSRGDRRRRRCACAWRCTPARRARATATTSGRRQPRRPPAWRSGTAARCSSRRRPHGAGRATACRRRALRDLGEHRLRDLVEPERVFQLLPSGLPRTSRRCAR